MTVRTANEAQVTVQPRSLRVGLVTATSVYSPGAGASVSAGDVIQMIKVPQGATVIYTGISSNYFQAAITLGDGLSAGRYFAGSTSAAMALSPINTVYVPYQYSTDDTIDITIGSTSVSSIAGSFNLIAVWSMDADTTA